MEQTPIKAELMRLHQAEKRAWYALDSTAESCSIHGMEGRKFLAWRAAADAEAAFRKANDLVGVPLYRIP